MKRETLGVALVKGGAVICSYGANYFLIRLMSQEDYGRFSLLMAIVTITSILVALGHPQILLRAVAASTSRKEAEDVGEIWRTSRIWVVLTSSIFIFAAGAFLYFMPDTPLSEQLFLASLILPVWAMLKLHSALLHGAGMTTIAQGAETVLRPAFFLSFILAYGFFTDTHLDAKSSILLNSLSFALALFLTARANRHYRSFNFAAIKQFQSQDKPKWLRASAALSAISAAQLLILNTDTLMIGHFFSDKEVALYRVSILLSMLVGSANEIVTVVIRPKIASAHARQSLSTALPQMRKMAIIASAVCAVIFFIFILYGRELLSGQFGEPYIDAYTPTLILIFGQVVSSYLGPVGLFLNMTHNESAHFKIIISVLLLNIILNFILIPFFGLLGAAVSSLVTLIAWRICAARKFEKISGLRYIKSWQ